MLVHRSNQYLMRGSGIGSIFSNIFKAIIPLATKAVNIGRKAATSSTGQKILKAAKRTAVDAGLDIANDVLKGENVKTSAKKNLKSVGSRFVDNAAKEFSTGGKKKKKKKKRAGVKKNIKKKSKSKKTTSVKKKKKRASTKKTSKKKSKKTAKSTRKGPDILRLWL